MFGFFTGQFFGGELFIHGAFRTFFLYITRQIFSSSASIPPFVLMARILLFFWSVEKKTERR